MLHNNLFVLFSKLKFQRTFTLHSCHQIAAENYVINQSWNANGVSSNMVDTIGIMVYSGATSLDWTKSYTNGPDQWSGKKLNLD